MTKNITLLFASIIFGIIAVLHLLKSIFSWQVLIEDFMVPVYFSYISIVVAGYLSWQLYNLSKK